MVRNDGGRLFQTSGPLTANARRPSSVRVRRMTAAPVKPSSEIVAVGPTCRSRRGRRRMTDTVESKIGA